MFSPFGSLLSDENPLKPLHNILALKLKTPCWLIYIYIFWFLCLSDCITKSYAVSNFPRSSEVSNIFKAGTHVPIKICAPAAARAFATAHPYPWSSGHNHDPYSACYSVCPKLDCGL